MTNVSKGDIAYVVKTAPGGGHLIGLVLEVVEYAGIRKFKYAGIVPAWYCQCSNAITGICGELVPANTRMIAPDDCLRRIAGPSIDISTETTLHLPKKEKA